MTVWQAAVWRLPLLRYSETMLNGGKDNGGKRTGTLRADIPIGVWKERWELI